jgi:tetratricopeptide (TPR) repeat protein
LDLLDNTPEAESLVQTYLQQAQAEPLIRQSYAQWLAMRQRHAPAQEQLGRVTQALPEAAGAWFQLGVVAVETRDRDQAVAALKRFLELDAAQRAARTANASASPAGPAPGDAAAPAEAASEKTAASGLDEDSSAKAQRQSEDARRTRALLLLAQLATEQGDYAEAQRWLQPLDGPAPSLDVQARRALILARQGKLEQARALLRGVPETSGADALAKVMAEAQLLRTVERWKDARKVLNRALERHPQDTDVLYELALVLERLGLHDEMERHLRRIMELRPDHPHAHNALGYSLAERGVRLEEAQRLIERALELAPGDPFITDSLAWVLFRQGQAAQAVELLRQAYAARPDTEIGAHLGEVLWSMGQRDEARKVWRESRGRDMSNKVLKDTLVRLKVDL